MGDTLCAFLERKILSSAVSQAALPNTMSGIALAVVAELHIVAFQYVDEDIPENDHQSYDIDFQ